MNRNIEEKQAISDQKIRYRLFFTLFRLICFQNFSNIHGVVILLRIVGRIVGRIQDALRLDVIGIQLFADEDKTGLFEGGGPVKETGGKSCFRDLIAVPSGFSAADG